MLGHSQNIQLTNIESWSFSHKLNIALVVILLYILYSSANEHFKTIVDDQRDNYATKAYTTDTDVIDAFNNNKDIIPIILSTNTINADNSGKFNGDNTWGFGSNSDGLDAKTNLFDYEKASLIISAQSNNFTTYL